MMRFDGYQSQCEFVSDRAERRAWAIQERCRGWSLLDPIFRPKGMHGWTFGRLDWHMRLPVVSMPMPLPPVQE